MIFKFEESEGSRLDQFLSKQISEVSREKIKNHIKEGLVLVNGIAVTKPKHSLLFGDSIEISLKEEQINDEILPWNEGDMPEVVFDNESYLVINKPSGLVVHPGTGNWDKTLVNILVAKGYELSMKETMRPGIVHRIDKNTSGLLIVAKTDEFHHFITKQFAEGKVTKVYELITDGKYKNAKGIIEVPIGRDQNNRKLMKATLENSKPAKSVFNVIESFKDNEYVEFNILTGRTHQIRVHSRFVGAPVLNDPEYGRKVFDPEFGQFLHAKKLSFVDMNGEEKVFEAKLPPKMEEKLNELRALK